MRDLTRSMMRFSWTTTVLGASRIASLASGGRAAPAPVPFRGRVGDRRSDRGDFEGLDGATWALQGQLGEMWQAAFQAGDDLRQEWAELAADALVPWRWPSAASRLAERSLDTLRIIRPDTPGALARQELKNKFEVFWLVKGVRGLLGHPPPGTPFELRPYVTSAYRLGAYRALWAVEGLGHDYVETELTRTESPRCLLRGPAVAELPANSLPMLHGGLGLAFAEHVLGSLSPASSVVEARGALERFVTLCRDNSQERFAGSAIEALGLDTRCFFPDLVPVIERGLEDLDDPVLSRFFWHGVGRAVYFLPVNFIPGYGSLWHAVEMARRETQRQASDESAWTAALAGVSFAFTMVNMAQPGILERVLQGHGEQVRGTAFGDGIVAAVVIRNEITPDTPVLRAFVDHRPQPTTAGLWREIVGDPCRRALDASGAIFAGQTTEVYRSLPRGRT